MSSPGGSVKPPERPGHHSRHSSSWINRLHRPHDRKHNFEQEEPLLANDLSPSDVEAQQDPQEPLSQRYVSRSGPKNQFDTVAEISKRTGNAISRNWKQILISCILTLLVVLISLLVGFYFRHRADNKMSISVCTSAACVHAASGILYNLDPAYAQLARVKYPSNAASPSYLNTITKDLSSDACTDFNQLVCGGFGLHHDLRPDQSDMFTGTLMVEDSQTILRHILEGDASKISSKDRPNFEKLKADYDSCMDEKTIKELGLKPLREVIDRVKVFFSTPEAAWKTSPVRSSDGQRGVSYTSANNLTHALLYMAKLEISGLVSGGIGVSVG
jgi:endothelin-converting enzyme